MSRFLLRWVPQSLAARIAAALVLVGLLPILVLWGVNLVESKRPNAVDQYFQLLADYAAQSVRQALEQSATAIRTVAQDGVVRAPQGDRGAMEVRLRQFNDLYPLFQHLTLVDLDGRTLASSTYRYRGEWRRMEFFQRAEVGEVSISPAHLPVGGQEPMISFAAPVRDQVDQVVGVLIGEIPMASVAHLVVELQVGKEGHAFVINSVAQVIAHRDPGRLMESWFLPSRETPSDGPLPTREEGGKDYLYAVAPVAAKGMLEEWLVVVRASTAEAYAYVARIQRLILFLSIGILGVIALVAAGLALSISGPVRKVSAAARRMATGDLSARVECSSRGELGELATFFNAMAQKLQAKVQTLQESRSRIVAAQEEVRREIAGHLHGRVQGRLLALKGRLQELLGRTNLPSDTAGSLRNLVLEMEQVIGQEFSVLSRRLYPSILRRGLVPALLSLRDQFEGALDVGMEFGMNVLGDERANRNLVPEPARLAAYRIVEEALTNVIKHARASRAVVRLELPSEKLLQLIVWDDGQGFDQASVSIGLGLVAMQDYAEAMGGQCVIHSAPGQGTEVSAILPLSGPGAGPPGTGSPWG